jgi:glycogen debranching enzyme
MIEIDRETLRDFERASRLEWLETNGLGDWAGSTLTGAHSRRGHHLLRLSAHAAAQPAVAAGAAAGAPAGAGAAAAGPRATVALAKLDELVIAGGHAYELACNRFPFVVAADGLQRLAGFRRDLFPVFEHEAGGVRLRKTIAMLEGESTLVVLYEVLAAPGPFVLALRPFFARREPHALCGAGQPGAAPAVSRGPAGLVLRWPAPGAEMHAGGSETKTSRAESPASEAESRAPAAEIHLAAAGVDFEHRPDWWYRFELEEERLRGLDFREDLWTPGLLRRELAAGERFCVVASADDPAGRDPVELLAGEARRRETLLGRLPVQDELTRILALAGDQFVLRRSTGAGGARGGDGGGRALAAGYPDGDETTADVLIALPGLLLATGRADDAKKVLRTYGRAVSGGTLPDRWPGAGDGEPTYAALDASLWLFVAAFRYLEATGDEGLVRESLLPALATIAAGHERGAANGLRAAEDGLLETVPGSPAAASHPGKAAAINALWHNALATLAELGSRFGDARQAKAWGERARRVQRRYAEVLWNAEDGCLHEAGGGDEAGRRRATTLRAHHVLALGLPFPALSKQRAQRLLRIVEERLYTPVGLRDSAAPDGDGAGGGLAWPWLLGPFLEAQVRLRGATGRRHALELLAEIDPLLSGGVIGTVAELAGVDPPHPMAGHGAHAASVGELLRVYVHDLQPPKAAPPARPPRPLKAKPKPAAAPRRRSRRARPREV